jgi:hypothetical protein
MEHVISNEQSVISVPDPSCPYDDDDPDSPDCTCLAIPNPRPDPMFDRYVTVAATFTMQPCGCQVRALFGPGGKMGGPMKDWKMYQQEVPEAGITCPQCGRTSYSPDDVREGYCGHCHDWTSPGSKGGGTDGPLRH